MFTQMRFIFDAKFEPTNHQYTTHLTYTGPHCALCGRPEDEHQIK